MPGKWVSELTATFSSSVTYWVSGYCNGVESTSRTPVSFTLLSPGAININPSVQPMICQGTSITLTPANGTNYSWSSSPGGAISGSGAITVSPSVNTTYTLTGTESNCGTTVTSTINVTVYPLVGTPSVPSGPSSRCQGGGSDTYTTSAANATGSPPYTWSLTAAAGSISSSGVVTWNSSFPASGVASVTAVVTVVANNGCGSSPPVSKNVIVYAPPMAYTLNAPPGICPGATVSIYLSGSQTGVSYQLYKNGNANGSAIAGNGSQLPFPGIIATGNYTIIASGTGCPSVNMVNSANLVALSPGTLSASKNPSTPICPGTSVQLTGGGGGNYSWTADTGGSWSGSAITVTPSSTTVYTLSGNESTCGTSASTTISVGVNPLPTAAASNQLPICSGTSTSIAVTNPNSVTGTSYSWTTSSRTNISGYSDGNSGGNSVYTIAQTLSSADGINTGFITYNITPSANNCPGTTVQVTVTVNPTPQNTNTAPQLLLSMCSGTALNFTPATSVNGTTNNWTTSVIGPIRATSVSYIGSGTITNTPINTGSTSGRVTYNITPSYNSCSGLAVNYIVTVNAAPMPIDQTNTGVYGSGTVQLAASPLIPADNIKWYTTLTGGTGTAGTTYTTLSLIASTTYYATETSPTTNCESARTPIIARVFAIIAPSSVKEEVIRTASVTQDDQIYSLSTSQKTTRTSFVDGLARTNQTQLYQASPANKDVIQPVQYDQWGQATKLYLPYTASTSGIFSQTFAVDQAAFYNNNTDKIADDGSPFAVALYEDSPIRRPKEQGGVGVVWQQGGSHSAKAAYSYNIASEVRQFNTDGSSSQFYPANMLDRTEVTNPNGFKTVAYSKSGQTIMKKTQIDQTIDGVLVDYLETYYIYDDFARVSYIIQPKGIAALKLGAWTLTQTIKDRYVFEFVYDKRGRLAQKKVPGAGWNYIVYDQLNRPVLTQDNNIRAFNQWVFIKYDIKGRRIMTGIYTDAVNTTLAAMQGVIDAKKYDAPTNPDLYYEVRQAATSYGYSNQAFPTTSTSTYTVNYYDDYDFNFDGTQDYSYTIQNLTLEGMQGRSLNLSTGSKKLIMGTSTWLINYVFYDKYGRPIQMRSNNHLNLANINNLNTVSYDFEGKAVQTKTYHDAGGSHQTTILRTPSYDFAGRLMNIQQQVNGGSVVMVAQYDYNEIGQVVDKKLHSTDGGTTVLQTVDYRFNIQGWLTSINNAQLNVDNKNGDLNDYFGMELLYNTTETGLNDQTGDKVYYNGNISAIKWKGYGAPANANGQRSYKFSYDESDQLLKATFQAYNAGWTGEVNTLNEAMTYDHNGNIYTLQRDQNQRGLTGHTPTSTAQMIDNLTYTYAAGNQLSKVDDATANPAGFNDGAQATTEYTYDTYGNLQTDLNTKMTWEINNFLGKARQVNFQDGHYFATVYDAAGNKLSMRLYNTSGVLQTITDYVNGFVYENNVLTFFSSPEGRVVNNAGTMEYQYAIADHQGNTRVVFTSAASTAQAVMATFESAAQASEALNFQNYPSSSGISPISSHNHTVGGTKSQYLNGGYLGQVGVSKSYKVFPGDQLQIEAYGSYVSQTGASNLAAFAGALLSAFALPAPANGEVGTPSAGINTWGGIEAGGYSDGTSDNTDPKAFVNIVLFDRNYNFLDVAYAQVNSSGSPTYISASYTVKEAGYAFLYVSNEHPTFVDVYFDDIKMTFTPSRIVQYNEYYPFGFQTAESWTRDNSKNNFLYDGGAEINTTSGWYDTFYRGYDPTLGRLHQIDPLAYRDHSFTPYHYAGNDPIGSNDPSGSVRQFVTWRDIKAENQSHSGLMAGDSTYPDWYLDGGGDGGGGGSQMQQDAAAVNSGAMSLDAYAMMYGTNVYQAGAGSATGNLTINIGNGGFWVSNNYATPGDPGQHYETINGTLYNVGPSNNISLKFVSSQGGGFWGSIGQGFEQLGQSYSDMAKALWNALPSAYAIYLSGNDNGNNGPPPPRQGGAGHPMYIDWSFTVELMERIGLGLGQSNYSRETIIDQSIGPEKPREAMSEGLSDEGFRPPQSTLYFPGDSSWIWNPAEHYWTTQGGIKH